MEEHVEFLIHHTNALKQRNEELETKITLLIEMMKSREDRIKELKILLAKLDKNI